MCHRVRTTETAASRLNFSQPLNSLGTILEPLFGVILLLGGVELAPEKIRALSAAAQLEYRVQQASSVRLPYLGVAATLLLLAGALAFLKLPSLGTRAPDPRLPPRPRSERWRC